MRSVGWVACTSRRTVARASRGFAAFRYRSVDLGSLRMIIGGAGPDEAEARDVARELGVSLWIKFREAATDAWRFLYDCDLLLISSVTEGLPLGFSRRCPAVFGW